MSTQFVDGWTIAEVLGEGAFGEVMWTPRSMYFERFYLDKTLGKGLDSQKKAH